MRYTECVPERELDLLVKPESSVWTTECLLPKGFCPSSDSDKGIEVIRQGAIHWTTDPGIQEWRVNRLKMLLSRLPEEPPNVVLDYGAYFGEVAEALAERWPSATVQAMDIDENCLTVMAERGVKAQYMLSRPGHVDASQESVDMIVMGDVAEHVYEDEWLSILEDSLLVLKPGGVLFTHSPIADVFVDKPVNYVVLTQMLELNHPSIKSVDYLHQTLSATGFVEVVSEACHENGAYGFARGRKTL